jgi:Xaa-Pro aminopeptidase
VVTADRLRLLPVLLLFAAACSASPAPVQAAVAAPPAPPIAPQSAAQPAPPAAPQAAPAPAPSGGQRLVAAEIYDEPEGNLAQECAQRRRDLAARIGGPCVVWIETPSGPELERFFQEDYFYYLTGVELPDIAMGMQVDADGQVTDEVLFLPDRDPNFEVWNGARLAPGPEAEAATGFRRTAPLEARLGTLAEWSPGNVHALREPEQVQLPADAALLTNVLDTRLDELRLVKSEYEIGCLMAAINITCAALREAIDAVQPGAYEYEPQGALEGTFLRLGAERPGFASIFGSGPNSVTLHYQDNRRQMQDGELLVMDVGAKYRYYCADVTRTVPVNGKFTPRQREVYDLVLKAQTAAFEAAKPGVTMRELDGIARQVITDGGFGPGRKYFMHGLGHWIGLDVHDVGGGAPIVPGTCFTIEPGIYIAEENLGVRIEDDYLMTAAGAVKLSGGVPSDPDEIEALLQR